MSRSWTAIRNFLNDLKMLISLNDKPNSRAFLCLILKSTVGQIGVKNTYTIKKVNGSHTEPLFSEFLP